jgi:hypothetical protein
MLLRALRLAARRPLAFLAVVVAIVVMTFGGFLYLGLRGSAPALEAEEGADEKVNPRLILNRAWFDKYPEKATDEVDLWIFFGGGMGVHETGSRYKATFEIFEIERAGSKLHISYLHEKKTVSTAFTVETCSDKRPFTVCLTLKDMPGGPLKLYGFHHDEELESAIPWGKSRVEAAKALSNGPKN